MELPVDLFGGLDLFGFEEELITPFGLENSPDNTDQAEREGFQNVSINFSTPSPIQGTSFLPQFSNINDSPISADGQRINSIQGVTPEAARNNRNTTSNTTYYDNRQQFVNIQTNSISTNYNFDIEGLNEEENNTTDINNIEEITTDRNILSNVRDGIPLIINVKEKKRQDDFISQSKDIIWGLGPFLQHPDNPFKAVDDKFHLFVPTADVSNHKTPSFHDAIKKNIKLIQGNDEKDTFKQMLYGLPLNYKIQIIDSQIFNTNEVDIVGEVFKNINSWRTLYGGDSYEKWNEALSSNIVAKNGILLYAKNVDSKTGNNTIASYITANIFSIRSRTPGEPEGKLSEPVKHVVYINEWENKKIPNVQQGWYVTGNDDKNTGDDDGDGDGGGKYKSKKFLKKKMTTAAIRRGKDDYTSNEEALISNPLSVFYQYDKKFDKHYSLFNLNNDPFRVKFNLQVRSEVRDIIKTNKVYWKVIDKPSIPIDKKTGNIKKDNKYCKVSKIPYIVSNEGNFISLQQFISKVIDAKQLMYKHITKLPKDSQLPINISPFVPLLNRYGLYIDPQTIPDDIKLLEKNITKYKGKFFFTLEELPSITTEDDYQVYDQNNHLVNGSSLIPYLGSLLMRIILQSAKEVDGIDAVYLDAIKYDALLKIYRSKFNFKRLLNINEDIVKIPENIIIPRTTTTRGGIISQQKKFISIYNDYYTKTSPSVPMRLNLIAFKHIDWLMGYYKTSFNEHIIVIENELKLFKFRSEKSELTKSPLRKAAFNILFNMYNQQKISNTFKELWKSSGVTSINTPIGRLLWNKIKDKLRKVDGNRFINDNNSIQNKRDLIIHLMNEMKVLFYDIVWNIMKYPTFTPITKITKRLNMDEKTSSIPLMKRMYSVTRASADADKWKYNIDERIEYSKKIITSEGVIKGKEDTLLTLILKTIKTSFFKPQWKINSLDSILQLKQRHLFGAHLQVLNVLWNEKIVKKKEGSTVTITGTLLSFKNNEEKMALPIYRSFHNLLTVIPRIRKNLFTALKMINLYFNDINHPKIKDLVSNLIKTIYTISMSKTGLLDILETNFKYLMTNYFAMQQQDPRGKKKPKIAWIKNVQLENEDTSRIITNTIENVIKMKLFTKELMERYVELTGNADVSIITDFQSFDDTNDDSLKNYSIFNEKKDAVKSELNGTSTILYSQMLTIIYTFMETFYIQNQEEIIQNDVIENNTDLMNGWITCSSFYSYFNLGRLKKELKNFKEKDIILRKYTPSILFYSLDKIHSLSTVFHKNVSSLFQDNFKKEYEMYYVSGISKKEIEEKGKGEEEPLSKEITIIDKGMKVGFKKNFIDKTSSIYVTLRFLLLQLNKSFTSVMMKDDFVTIDKISYLYRIPAWFNAQPVYRFYVNKNLSQSSSFHAHEPRDLITKYLLLEKLIELKTTPAGKITLKWLVGYPIKTSSEAVGEIKPNLSSTEREVSKTFSLIQGPPSVSKKRVRSDKNKTKRDKTKKSKKKNRKTDAKRRRMKQQIQSTLVSSISSPLAISITTEDVDEFIYGIMGRYVGVDDTMDIKKKHQCVMCAKEAVLQSEGTCKNHSDGSIQHKIYYFCDNNDCYTDFTGKINK